MIAASVAALSTVPVLVLVSVSVMLVYSVSDVVQGIQLFIKLLDTGQLTSREDDFACMV